MFDFDGVIVDTLGISYGINTEVNSDLSLSEYQKLFSGNISELANKDPSHKLHPNFHGRYKEETRTLAVPENIRDLLERLSARFTLAIISGSQTSTIKDIITREGVVDCFSDVLGYDVDSSKVVRIKIMLDQYGIQPDQTIFITDTSGDVYEAHECGVSSIAVTWGFQSRGTLADAKPRLFVDSVAELEQGILGFFSGTIGE